jgi:anti-sigma B factor antagonist
VLGTYEGVRLTSRSFLIDFSKVEYINSSGIALVIIRCSWKPAKRIKRSLLFGLTPHFQKVFTMVGIGKYAGLHKDQETAAASL